jgi:hypothetical protein
VIATRAAVPFILAAMRRLSLAAALAALAFASPALADDAACIQSYEATQTLRKANKLREAQAEATKCAVETCPAVLSKDCQRWAAEIDALLPSIVLEVRGSAGEPLTNVKVTANGQPLVDRVDATPIVLAPGEVKLHFESPDGHGLPVDRTIALREGEKSKKVSVRLGGAAPAAPPP